MIIVSIIAVEDMDLRQMTRVRVMDQDLRQPPIQIPIVQPIIAPVTVESSLPPQVS